MLFLSLDISYFAMDMSFMFCLSYCVVLSLICRSLLVDLSLKLFYKKSVVDRLNLRRSVRIGDGNGIWLLWMAWIRSGLSVPWLDLLVCVSFSCLNSAFSFYLV